MNNAQFVVVAIWWAITGIVTVVYAAILDDDLTVTDLVGGILIGSMLGWSAVLFFVIGYYGETVLLKKKRDR